MSHLSEPIPGEQPTGVDLREDPSRRAVYYAIKDARSNARAAERAMLNGSAEGDGQMRLPPQWGELRQLAREALVRDTKDIELLCWLIEAEARLGGIAGLASAFADTHEVVIRYWDALHSIDVETVADKVAPFSGLNGTGAEGTLIQPLRFIPLVPGAPYYETGLWAYQMSQRDASSEMRGRLRSAVDEAGVEAMTAYLIAVEDALRGWVDLSGALDALTGADAPPSSNVRNLLEEMAAAIRNLAGLTGEVRATEAAAPTAAPEPMAAAPVPATPVVQAASVIATREDAFQELLRIAAFFRRTEPHSPISFVLETLVRRGRMDFVALLAELVPDEHARTQVLTMAGIKKGPTD